MYLLIYFKLICILFYDYIAMHKHFGNKIQLCSLLFFVENLNPKIQFLIVYFLSHSDLFDFLDKLTPKFSF